MLHVVPIHRWSSNSTSEIVVQMSFTLSSATNNSDYESKVLHRMVSLTFSKQVLHYVTYIMRGISCETLWVASYTIAINIKAHNDTSSECFLAPLPRMAYILQCVRMYQNEMNTVSNSYDLLRLQIVVLNLKVLLCLPCHTSILCNYAICGG